ncbi:MAG: hypothetical protein ACK55I_24910, partial [bacterium]
VFEDGELAADFVGSKVTDLGQCGLLVFEDELSGVVGGKLDDDGGRGGILGGDGKGLINGEGEQGVAVRGDVTCLSGCIHDGGDDLVEDYGWNGRGVSVVSDWKTEDADRVRSGG